MEQTRGLIYISHLPHGFYEDELKNYFKQFGKVTNVKVCRSSRTGRCKGYGYVEFAHPDVAKIAADTMNNYLMFKKRITGNTILILGYEVKYHPTHRLTVNSTAKM